MSSKLLIITTTIILVSVLIAKFDILVGSLINNEKVWEGENVISLVGAGVGPESFAFDPVGLGPYTGISDGRIIRWEEHQRSWMSFSITSPHREGCGGQKDEMEHICGRPLGLCFNKNNGELYIADAYMGLLTVGPEGGLARPIVQHAPGGPLTFTNSLDIDQSTGAVYFTDSSLRYARRNHMAVILSGDNSGRLMKYDPQSQKVDLLVANLSFPNGVALSKDGDFILVVETTKCRVLKYWIKTSKAGSVEVFSQLHGFPDNIKSSPRGGYWVGIHSRKGKLLELILSNPWIGNILLKLLPIKVIMKVQPILAKFSGTHGGMGVRLSENGGILETFQGKNGNLLSSISEVMEKDGKLWIGSIDFPFAQRYNI